MRKQTIQQEVNVTTPRPLRKGLGEGPLPTDFCALMRKQYGDEVAERLFEGLSADPSVSIRLNPKKRPSINGEKDSSLLTLHSSLHASEVPWCPDAFYLDERPAFTFDPLFHAGAYYVQEASSMYLAEVLRKHFFTLQHTDLSSPRPSEAKWEGQGGGSLALDLCAAPGGKSTLLRSFLPDDCWLVSNEPMPKRAQVLAENIIKWGHPNSIVTQNFPADYTFMADAFDLIVTDVPCSGEGMFRKDEGAIRDWSLENVDLCWHRQRNILTDIWPTLKDGGLLIYSTCTFNHFEDEDNARWIAEHLGAELLEERHFLPGTDHGEGFYIAALRKNGTSPQSTEQNDKERQNATTRTLGKIRRNLKLLHDSEVVTTQKEIATPKDRNKATNKQQKNKELIPPHAVAMSTAYVRGTYPECELSYDEALAYLRHDVLRIEAPKGIVLVTFRGVPLGFVKNIGSRANNLYPQEWRIRTTYTTPFTLGMKKEE